jgi:hypothetical protein
MRWLPLLWLAGCDSVFLGDRPPDAPIVAPPADVPQFECPADYEAVGGSHYRILEQSAELLAQRVRCRDDDRRYTHLAVFETLLEMGDVKLWIDAKPATTNDYLYVGGVQAGTATQLREGWRWVTKAVIDEALWLANEPDDADNNENHDEDAAVVLRGSPIGLIDIAKTSELRAVCECDGIADE